MTKREQEKADWRALHLIARIQGWTKRSAAGNNVTNVAKFMSRNRILVVDDEPMVRESLELMLKSDGHLIEMVGSGAEALQCYEPGKYAVILTDNRMSGMTGLQLAAKLKGLNPAQPIVLFTGSPPMGAKQNCDLVLLKPFSARDLRNAVAGLLNKPSSPD